MRILVFSWRDIKHPLAGGAEQVMHEHAKGWVGAGHSVTHFSSEFPRSKKEEKIDGINLVRNGYQYIGVQISGFFYYLNHKKDFDLVVDEFHGIPFFTPLYVKVPKIAVIQETAGKVWFLNPIRWPVNWIIGLIGYILEPFIFLLYKDIPFMVGSQSAKEDIIYFGIPAKNITVVPHGVIVTKLKVKSLSRAKSRDEKLKVKTVVYLGILSKDKGIEDALRCFSILNRRRNFNFWVLGRPETKKYGEKIMKLSKKLRLNSKIKFWGFVSQAKKFELLSRAHVLVNPSVHEGWGLVNIEANTVGTPVIAYNVSGIVDSVKDGLSGIICKRNNADDLAENVVRMLNDELLYKKLQSGSLSWSKNFRWEKSQKLSLSLIEQIANTK